MNIIYLTWGETPRSYGVYGSQVIGQFVANARAQSQHNYHLVAGVPIVNSSLIREGRAYKNETLKIKKMLGDVSFQKIAIFAPQNFIFSNRYTFHSMHWFAHKTLANIVKNTKPAIIHTRSYHATYAALKTKQKYGFDYKIIFDARGVWPEEVAWKKKYSPNSENYLFLKKIEHDLLTHSDITVILSETMETLLNNDKNFNTRLIYTSADTQKLKSNIPPALNKKQPNIIKLCYIGALADSTWHSPDQLQNLYNHILKLGFDPYVKIITTSDHEKLRNSLPDISSEKLDFISTSSTEELLNALSDVHIGLLPYRKNTDEFAKIVGSSIVGTKTAEYLSAGLPILVNENCGGAAILVEKYGLGLCYNPDSFANLTAPSLSKMLEINTDEIKKTAEQLFDYESNARQYHNLYSDLTSVS